MAHSSLFAIALLGCGSTATSSPLDSTDAGLDSAPAAETSDGGPNQFAVPCHDLQLQGPAVMTIGRTEPLPAAEGGTVVDGTYVLTAVNRYGTTAEGRVEMDDPQRFTLAVRGTVIQQTSESQRSVVRRTTVTFTTAGAKVEPTLACGILLVSPLVEPTYTATPTILTLFEAPASLTYTFTRQQ